MSPDRTEQPPSPRRPGRAVFLNLAERVSWLLLVPAVIVATRVLLGERWALWSIVIVAILSARRELTRLFLSPLSPALREAVLARPEPPTEPLRELARRHGLRSQNVLFWPDEDLPDEAPAAYFLIQGMPIFLLGRRLPALLSKEELQAVFAHELSHHILGHVKRTALARVLADVASAGAACAVAWRLTLIQAAGWPLLEQGAAVLLAWGAARACLQVALNAYSRRQELRADRKAVEITGDAAAFVSAYRKLAELRGAAEEPPRWKHVLFAESPSLKERLAAIETNVNKKR